MNENSTVSGVSTIQSKAAIMYQYNYIICFRKAAETSADVAPRLIPRTEYLKDKVLFFKKESGFQTQMWMSHHALIRTGRLDRSPKHIQFLGEPFAVAVFAFVAAVVEYSLVVAVAPIVAEPTFPNLNTNYTSLHHVHSFQQSVVRFGLDSLENIGVPYQYR